MLNTSPKVRLTIKDEIARFCTTADLAASVAFRQGPWHKQLTSKGVRETLFRTLVMADLRSHRWMDTFDGYRATSESLLQRESGDGCNQQQENEC